MGGSIGASLVVAGRPVLFVEKDVDHLEAMNGRGLRITGPVAELDVPVVAVHPDDLRGYFSTVLLCVKAHHTGEALGQVEEHLAGDGAVVSIQNGLCELDIEEALGAERTIGAFVNFGADYLEPGLIHRGNRGAVVVGELDGRTTSRVGKIHANLRLFEPGAILTANIFGYLWGKLAYAALLFATAVTHDSIAEALDAPRHRPLLRALGREVVGVALARGVTLEAFDGFEPGAFLPEGADKAADASLDKLVAFNRASAKTHSGIWRDLAVRRRQTEVDAQLGRVVELAAEVGVPTPLISRLIHQVHEIEEGKRAQRRENLDELWSGGLS